MRDARRHRPDLATDRWLELAKRFVVVVGLTVVALVVGGVMATPFLLPPLGLAGAVGLVVMAELGYLLMALGALGFVDEPARTSGSTSCRTAGRCWSAAARPASRRSRSPAWAWRTSPGSRRSPRASGTAGSTRRLGSSC